MSDGPPVGSSSSAGGTGRFTAKKRAEPAVVLAEQSLAKSAALISELQLVRRRAASIIAKGRDAFLDTDDETLYLAAQTVLVNFQDTVTMRLPASVKQEMRDVPWVKIKGMRNRLAHDYRDTQKVMVWELLSRDIPPLLERLLTDGVVRPDRWGV